MLRLFEAMGPLIISSLSKAVCQLMKLLRYVAWVAIEAHEQERFEGFGEMAKFLKVKFDYKDETEKIAVTRVDDLGGQIFAYNGDQKVGEFSKAKIDTFAIPIAKKDATTGKVVPGYFKMRTRFADFAGKFVDHCHILAHEDRGMMQLVEVIDNKTVIKHH
jgi:hypothetical protein